MMHAAHSRTVSDVNTETARPGNQDAAAEVQATPRRLPRYYKPATIARQFDFSKQAIYKRIRNGELPAVRICGSLRVKESDVLAWLDREDEKPLTRRGANRGTE